MTRDTLVEVARRPSLWGVALRQAYRWVPRRWWRRAPFLPVPDRAYWAFRMETVYGIGEPGVPRSPPGALRTPPGADVVEYLRWCTRMERTVGNGAGRHAEPVSSK